MLRQVLQSQRRGLFDDDAQNSVPGRQRADQLPVGVVDTGEDELAEHSAFVQNAQRSVSCPHQIGCGADDLPQSGIEFESGRHRQDRFQQRIHPAAADVHDVLDPGPDLGQQLLQPRL